MKRKRERKFYFWNKREILILGLSFHTSPRRSFLENFGSPLFFPYVKKVRKEADSSGFFGVVGRGRGKGERRRVLRRNGPKSRGLKKRRKEEEGKLFRRLGGKEREEGGGDTYGEKEERKEK